MKALFYDIESLQNIFTLAVFDPNRIHIDFYAIDDDQFIFTGASDTPKDPSISAKLLDYVKLKNPGIYDTESATFTLHNLLGEQGWHHYLNQFGAWFPADYDDNKKLLTLVEKLDCRIVADTDAEYDEDLHPYLMGYNSYNYDTTMMAFFAYHRLEMDINPKVPVTARELRELNDWLFHKEIRNNMPQLLLTPVAETDQYRHDNHIDPIYLHFKSRFDSFAGTYVLDKNYKMVPYKIRQSMLRTGRYIDVARLNEKQSKVRLKRLLGMLGYQILESDKLNAANSVIENKEELFDLIAYNASDVINLYHLFNHKAYKSQFEIKKNMLTTYPELVYETNIDDEGHLSINTNKPRRNRLCADSSSQQLTSRTLCPVDHLFDNQKVWFDYPSKDKAAEIGLDGPYNVLAESKRFFTDEVLPKIQDKDERIHVRDFMNLVFSYYDDIEGKNFNESASNADKMYDRDGNLVDREPRTNGALSLASIAARPNCVPYYGPDGKPTSCFVTFSTGGIHGAEYNKALYEYDMAAYSEASALMAFVKELTDDDPVHLRNMVTPATAPIPAEFPDGREHFIKEFLKSGFTKKSATFKTLKKPELFKKKDNSEATELADRYVWTSAGLANHEDFSSYYPNLLRMMGAFKNDAIGRDRYGDMYDNKQTYGDMMKDEATYTKSECDIFNVKRNGVKLFLNTASGAGDATFDNPIRMNNKIITMRIIGQLFSWRIGQAQALAGARVPSTNTDGLYTFLNAGLNQEILNREKAKINVAIDTEELNLISKDSNNRIEYKTIRDADGNIVDHKIIAANGGSLACWEGPDPTKSLSHPAIMDYILTQYLMGIVDNYGEEGLLLPYNPEIGLDLMRQAMALESKTKKGKIHLLTMFQNVIVSSTGSITYNFAIPTGKSLLENDDAAYEASYSLNHCDRVFIMDKSADKLMPTVHIRAAVARVITPATEKARANRGERMTQDNDLALKILAENSVGPKDFRNAANGKQREAMVKKITNVEPDWHMYIDNRSLHEMDEKDIDLILDNLSLTCYNYLIESTYNKNWRNNLPTELWPENIREIHDTWFGSENETKTEE